MDQQKQLELQRCGRVPVTPWQEWEENKIYLMLIGLEHTRHAVFKKNENLHTIG